MSTIQAFIKDFTHILAAAHCTDPTAYRDNVQLGLIQLFSHSVRSDYYARQLLYRDFNESDNFIIAEFYIDDVLWLRCLQVANTSKAKPSNAHLLLTRLCALNADSSWRGVMIHRSAQPDFMPSVLASFRRTAEALAKHDKPIEQYSEVAKRRQAEFGDFYLTLAHSGAKVPAELSLHVIFSCCPQPLVKNFTEDGEFTQRFGSTVEHLNERYALLRSCGLDPKTWIDDKVSIQQLRELKALRKLAKQSEAWLDNRPVLAYRAAFPVLQEQLYQLKILKKLAKSGADNELKADYLEVIALFQQHLRKLKNLPKLDEQMPAWIDVRLETFYRKILVQLQETAKKSKKKPVASFATFEQWLASDIGAVMTASPLEDWQSCPQSDDPTDEWISLEDEEIEDTELKKTACFASLVDLFPKAFSPVMAYLFAHLLDKPNWKLMVADDTRLAVLLAREPRYQGLQGASLAEQLWQDAEKLVTKKLIGKRRL